jgi:hypothetical protein
MSAEATLQMEQHDAAAAASVAAAPMAAACSHPTVRQVRATAARPSNCASTATAASSSIHAAVLCAPRQQSSSPLLTQLPIGQQLHKDALHSVLAYLSLTELPSAMRSCRAWYAAVRSLPLRNDPFPVQNAWQLRELTLSASSSLIRHIVKCDVLDPYTAAELAPFVACLPRLRSLTHWSCSSTELHPQLYSSHLRELMVNFVQQSNGPPVPRDDSSDSDSDVDQHCSDSYSYDEPWRELALQ